MTWSLSSKCRWGKIINACVDRCRQMQACISNWLNISQLLPTVWYQITFVSDGHLHDMRLHFHGSLSQSGYIYTKKSQNELSTSMCLCPLSSVLVHLAQLAWFWSKSTSTLIAWSWFKASMKEEFTPVNYSFFGVVRHGCKQCHVIWLHNN